MAIMDVFKAYQKIYLGGSVMEKMTFRKREKLLAYWNMLKFFGAWVFIFTVVAVVVELIKAN